MDEPGEVKLFPPTLNRICYGWVSVISSTELNRNQICNLLEKLILLASSDVHSHYPSGVVKKIIYYHLKRQNPPLWEAFSLNLQIQNLRGHLSSN